jgi:hypothetical protein
MSNKYPLDLTEEEIKELRERIKLLKEWAESDEGKESILAASRKSMQANVRRKKNSEYRCCKHGCCMCRRY